MSAAAPASGESERPAPTVRRHELDWLRTVACFGLIPFHTAVVFTSGAYDYVKNGQTSEVFSFLVSFITAWGIPLLFLIAGGSARYALPARGVKQYLNERVTRLLVPFLFAEALIVPFQVYIGRLSSPGAPSYPVFYGQFLWSLALIFTGKLPRGPDWIGHLWFIPPLMVFAALGVPWAALLRTARGRAVVDWLAGWRWGLGPLLALGLPMVVVNWLALEGVRYMVTTDTAFASNAIGVMTFLLDFLYGYLLYLDGRFLASVRRDVWTALALGMAAWLYLRYGVPALGDGFAGAWWGKVATAALRGYSGWWLTVGVLGLGVRFLSFTNSAERYLARAAYPVYIIHMPILSLIAFWVVPLDFDIASKFILITVASVAVSLAIYEGLIQRIGVLRLLFGLERGARRKAPPLAVTGPGV